MKYRPWGPVDWTLSISSQKAWHFIGAVATEERSLCSCTLLRSRGVLCGESHLQITDVDSEKYRDQIRDALSTRQLEFVQSGGALANIQQLELMSELFQIMDFCRNSTAGKSSVVLDITSLPKRFFFPFLRHLTQNPDIHNLIITYTSPDSYADGPLYEDIEHWTNLPGFGGSAVEKEHLIVSVGFLVESLTQYFSAHPDHGKIKILVPFPSPLPALKRTWESIANLERGHDGTRFEKYRVETLDMSAAFDRIVSLASNSHRPTAFAPFGPKPTSAAMCLYSIQRGATVYYPQPTVYHPEYSRGIKHNDPTCAVSAYWIKHEGENLYAI